MSVTTSYSTKNLHSLPFANTNVDKFEPTLLSAQPRVARRVRVRITRFEARRDLIVSEGESWSLVRGDDLSWRRGDLSGSELGLHFNGETVLIRSRHGSLKHCGSESKHLMLKGPAVVESDEFLLTIHPVPSSAAVGDPKLVSIDSMIGNSRPMLQLCKAIRRAASVSAPVLIQGESGSGKELVASALHSLSRRAAGPFVALNMGAFPDNLADSELFGHERGAFTGADRDRAGAFETSRGGTLFLDEIAELTPSTQVKLLRALENLEFRPVGASNARRVESRVIAACWANLDKLVTEGRFRADLYHRLAVITIRVPPLRQRLEDIPELVEHFRKQISADLAIRPFTPAALAVLMAYHWPGNIRELRNVVLRAHLTCSGPVITGAETRAAIEGVHSSLEGVDADLLQPATNTQLQLAEPSHPQSLHSPSIYGRVRVRDVNSVFIATGCNISATARKLGVARSTVRAWLRAQALSGS